MAGISPLIRIENATWRDLGELRSLENECFGPDAWPLLDLISVLTLPGIVRLKAVTPEGVMAGFIAGERHVAERIGWITTVGVLEAYRTQHIGSQLLDECEERMDLPRVRLCVRHDNLPALKMYDKAGYQRINIWKAYYQDGQDAVVLEKVRGLER